MVMAMVVTFGLVASNVLFCQSPVGAQPPSRFAEGGAQQPSSVARVEAQETPAPVPQAWPLVIRCSTFVTPVFETGATGERVSFTVEVRMDPRWKEANIPTQAWRENLPDRVKEALESALAEAVGENPPAYRRRDQILDRLDKIERRLKQIERVKSDK
jgi:hypothetical protein